MTQQIPGQSGQDAALVQRVKGYTRRQVLDFIIRQMKLVTRKDSALGKIQRYRHTILKP